MQVSRSSLAKSEFQKLKSSLVTALVLTVLDMRLQFMVELGDSNFGSGVVLSQQIEKRTSNPGAFLSHQISPTGKSHDVG